MDSVLIHYVNNKSSRYDGKDFYEPLGKIHQQQGTTGDLAIGETVTIKTKSSIIFLANKLVKNKLYIAA